MFRHCCCSWFLRRCLAARWWSLSRKSRRSGGIAASARASSAVAVARLAVGLAPALRPAVWLPRRFGFRVQRLGEVPARLVEPGCHVVPRVDGGFRIELAGLADQLVQRGLRGAGRIIRWFRVRRRFHGLVQRVPAFPPRVRQRLGFDEPVDLAGQCAGSFRGLVGLGGEPFGLADGQAGAFGPDEFAVRCDEVT